MKVFLAKVAAGSLLVSTLLSTHFSSVRGHVQGECLQTSSEATKDAPLKSRGEGNSSLSLQAELKSFPLVVERLSKIRMQEYSSLYQTKVSYARWFRRGVVSAAFLSCLGAFGYSYYSQPPTPAANTLPPPKNLPNSLDDKGLKSQEIALQRERLDFEMNKQSWKNLVRRSLIMGVAGGFSLSLYNVFTKLLTEAGGGLHRMVYDLWHRNEKFYFFWWRERTVEQMNMLKDLLANISAMTSEAQIQGMQSKRSSLFYSYSSELVNCERNFIYFLERILGIAALSKDPVLTPGRDRLVIACNAFAEELEKALQFDQEGVVITMSNQALLKAFYLLHDAFYIFIQTYQARLHEGV